MKLQMTLADKMLPRVSSNYPALLMFLKTALKNLKTQSLKDPSQLLLRLINSLSNFILEVLSARAAELTSITVFSSLDMDLKMVKTTGS